VFIEAKDDGSSGDNCSYKSCKAPVKSSPPTNQQPQHLSVFKQKQNNNKQQVNQYITSINTQQ